MSSNINVFRAVGAVTPCTWLLPVLKLELKRHHRLDSNDSEEYLSICCHLHTLQKGIHRSVLSVIGQHNTLHLFEDGSKDRRTVLVKTYHLDETFWRQIAPLVVYLDIPL